MSAMKIIQSGLTRAMAAAVPVIERLLREDSGQDLIEYALVFTFVGFGVIAAMKSVTSSVIAVFASVGTALTNAV